MFLLCSILLSYSLFGEYVLASKDGNFFPVSKCSYTKDKKLIEVIPCYTNTPCVDKYEVSKYRCSKYLNSCFGNIRGIAEGLNLEKGIFRNEVIYKNNKEKLAEIPLQDFTIENIQKIRPFNDQSNIEAQEVVAAVEKETECPPR